jgi:hypothetical protein
MGTWRIPLPIFSTVALGVMTVLAVSTLLALTLVPALLAMLWPAIQAESRKVPADGKATAWHAWAEGTVNELKASIGNSSLQLRVQDPQDIQRTRQIVERVLQVRSSVSAEAGKVTAPMADADRVTDLLVALRNEGIRLAEISVQKPTLDEVFLTITGHGVEENQSSKTETTELMEEATV